VDGLMTFCHDARKGRNIGSHWPNHVRASAPLDLFPVGCGSAALRPCVFGLIPRRGSLYLGIRLRQWLTWTDETGPGRTAADLPARQHRATKLEISL